MRFTLTLAAIALAGRAAATVPTANDVRTWLADYCLHCHAGAKPKGGVDLRGFLDATGVPNSARLSKRVVEQVESHEMPPAGAKALAPAQRAHLVGFLRSALAAHDASNPDPGPAVLRRLSRTEYDRTMRDLLGMDGSAAASAGLPEESPAQSYENLADAMTLPPTLLEKYLAAADAALDRLYAGGRVDANGGSPEGRAARAAFDAVIGSGTDRTAARAALARFNRRAYRRPPAVAEIDRLLALYDAARQRGEPHAAALRWPLKAILVSPHFLYRVERDRPGEARAYRVNDHELAVRLSYFLWATMPDAALFAAADAGRLSDPAEYERQVSRMLSDPKARALTDQFAAQWLQLRKLADARPSTEFFPTFTPQLKDAMAEEVRTYVDRLRSENRSVLELIDSGYTYVNADLAAHYSLKGVSGHEFRRVALAPGDHRGGLLGMAAVLALTSHTSRTSPTLRGKYVLEVIFGTPPPPPPPDVGNIDDLPKGRAAKSFRELLNQHATKVSCAGCHRKIDPLGFGLDQFDAIGRWRTGIDASGKLPGGETFDGFDGLKAVLLRRQDEFVRNVASQMLTYALGRHVRDADEPAVTAIATAAKADGYRYAALVRAVANSYPMLHRRNAPAE